MIELKSKAQLDSIKKSSEILVKVLNSIKLKAVPGVKTDLLDSIARDMILSSGAKCAFLGYKGYPKTICTSVNEEIVHGIPGERILKDGDIVSIDAGVELDGYFSDAAVTVAIGNIDKNTQRLTDVTREALYKAIDVAKIGARISDISCAIQDHAESNGFAVIREFVGHGIGICLHEDPQIPNFGQRGMGARLKEGMVLAIEPMVSAGKWEAAISEDGWTAATKDKSLTAHFEHTVAITGEGPVIMTDGIM